jgi:acetyl-CoA synthetase
LADIGIKAGDRVAIDMPMTVESVAIYLGAVAAGCPVVTVADSFAPAEIAVRLKIGEARCIFTQDFALRGGKKLLLYERVRDAGATPAIVVPSGQAVDCGLRDGDMVWQDLLSDRTDFQLVSRDPADFSTILFSSGTTFSALTEDAEQYAVAMGISRLRPTTRWRPESASATWSATATTRRASGRDRTRCPSDS